LQQVFFYRLILCYGIVPCVTHLYFLINDRLLKTSKEVYAEVCDATTDAIKYKSRLHKKSRLWKSGSCHVHYKKGGCYL